MNPNGSPFRPASLSRRWPLILIAAPAAVAIWSGWVRLGGMCGFGPVNLLPGIGTGFHLNTAITLPVGVEAYGAYTLGVWMRPGAIPDRARMFAKWSALGALALGMTGQVISHLLTAAGAAEAPWPVTVLVSCMPVAVVGLGAALIHLLRAGEDGQPDAVSAPVPTDAQSAALLKLRATTEAGNPLSGRQLQEQFRLSRAEVTRVRELADAERGRDGEAAPRLVPAASPNGNGSGPHA